MFIDLTYLTEERIRIQHGTLNPFACLLLPGPMEMEKEDKNVLLGTSYYGLAELDHFLSGKLFKQHYYPGVHEVESTEKPFKMVFLVDYLNSRGFALQSEVERNYMCREILLAMILSPLGVNLKSLPQIQASLSRKISGKNTSYGSFGISLLKFPAPLVRKYVAFRLGEKILSDIYIRDDFNRDRLNKDTEGYINKLQSSVDSSFIPKSPKLDRKQFEAYDPSIVYKKVKMEAELLESRLIEELENEFQDQYKKNLHNLKKEFDEDVTELSDNTETALKSAKIFIENISNEIKKRKASVSNKLTETKEKTEDDEKNHLKAFKDTEKIINSFKVPVLNIIIPPKRINILGYLSFGPILLIILAFVVFAPLGFILSIYVLPLVWYLLSWKKYFDA